MKRVERSEILPLGDYEAVRGPFRNRIIAEKRRRRLHLGSQMSVIFENHDTVLLQVQEMLRTERISKEDAIKHELDTYNELVPGDDEFSMTLFIEIAEKAEREHMLTALAGMEQRVFVEVDGKRVAAIAGEREGAEPTRTTAVQYYKVPLPADMAAALRAGSAKNVSVVVDHAAYQHSAALAAAGVEELASDLRN